MNRTLILLAALLAISPDAWAQDTPSGVDAATATIDAALIAGSTRFLSNDLLGGRGPGTQGERIAQAYIAAQMEAAGLEPAGVQGSWLQPFTLVKLTADPPEAVTLTGPTGETLSLSYREEFIAIAGRQEPRAEIDGAEVVFVGYGIVAPEEEWDDYEGADISGKVLLFLNNDPTGDRFGGDTRLYYGRWTYKYEIAAQKGAVGALVIHTSSSAGYPWQVVQTSWSGTQLELPAGDEPRTEVNGWLTREAAERLVALAGRDLDDLVTQAQRPEFAAVPLGVTLDVAFDQVIERTETANVIGRLPGTELADEHVLYTAHYDHMGIGEPVEGDSIYNGALDNALGVGSLLAIAGAFDALPEPLRRSILFAAVGAEEHGLLGSEYLAANPVVPTCDIVANINMDGGNMWGPTRDIGQVGRGRSTLDAVLDRHAAAQGRVIEPEERPDRGYFYRSDQFSFAKVGIPALYLDQGTDFVGQAEEWGADQVEAWINTHYHQPSDEMTPAWNLEGEAQDDALLFKVGLHVANADERPTWTPGDEFADERAACDVGAGPPEGAAPPAATGLEGVRWVLVELPAADVAVEPAGVPDLQLDPAERRAGGHSGCNRYGGGYALDGRSLRFSALMSTKMACEVGMETEAAFMRALDATRAWEIRDGRLLLLDDQGTTQAAFEPGSDD